MKILIVDQDDKLIDAKERDMLDYDKNIYRVSALWITNSNGEILLAKRAYSKKHDPGKWGPAVAGTVEAGETYYSNIIKEAEEELGIKKIKPRKWTKERVRGRYNYFTQWFYLILDKEVNTFDYDKDEVAEVRWFTKEEILNLIDSNPEMILSGIKKWINFDLK